MRMKMKKSTKVNHTSESVLVILSHRLLSEHVMEERISTHIAAASCRRHNRMISVGKAEFLIGSIKVAFLACETDNVVRKDTVFGVVELELCDTSLIGVCRDGTVMKREANDN